ncbi:uncharacterized protein J7T54_004464 [Emericellopsis cladophorae]|uniref:GPI-anchor transamidase n=1 Tax=Emericellopsis cladophorae TaxID=2686198 RepID=A0A9Q0BEZ7_9HYPO|nr:uncharacterized protein J7T54_004464 [Emericellopsis cladophorae]KAI6783437.1 hypothetical protein J7T54_004464 [Emericellopsis cladophorae]
MLFNLRLALVATMLLGVALAEHTNNWAVLVGTSRFWFNYRHMANVLAMYRTVKRLGIPDSQIIMMLPDDMACNPRNSFPGTVYSNSNRAVDLYGDNIEVDYRGYEVTVENFIRLLTDRVGPDTPRSKRLLTDDRSNILVYMTGHGGNEFLKFQDAEEIGAWDLANAFEQMWEKKRYHEILFMIDTCQANTMFSRLYSPNIIATGSSKLDQSSYSHHADNDVGVAVIDRYTYYNLEFLEGQVKDINSKKSIGELFDSYDISKIHSDPGIRYDLFPGGADAARGRLITDFFGNIQNVEVDKSKDPGFDEEMLELSKTIARLMKKAEEEEAAALNQTASMPASVPTEPASKILGATALTDDSWWSKKVIGVSALAGCALLWGLAWSCDAELAVATDDTVHIFLPEYNNQSDESEIAIQSQFTLSISASNCFMPLTGVNNQLCAQAGVTLPPTNLTLKQDGITPGFSKSAVTGRGTVSQVVRVEWSPNGLGANLRPILMVLTTSGELLALGEQDDPATSGVASFQTRNTKMWKILWGIGAGMPIPAEDHEGAYRTMDERIVGFSWAKEAAPGQALLAYETDQDEIVVMSIQHVTRPGGGHVWQVREAARFDGDGPHGTELPLYMAVRSSVTAKNQDWYETNDIEGQFPTPLWVRSLSRKPTRTGTRYEAPQALADSGSEESSSDEEQAEDERVDEEGMHTGAMEGVHRNGADRSPKKKIPLLRYRLQGVALSPGGGCSAVLVEKQSTVYPGRKAACKVYFSHKVNKADDDEGSPLGTSSKKLTTEARTWEWMYGVGDDVPGVTVPIDHAMLEGHSPMRDFFKLLKAKQKCPLCQEKVRLEGLEARCSNNHTFASCSSSGLAILAPGVSRTCAVCRNRCLKYSELVRLATEEYGPAAPLPGPGELCGYCGGKFII